MDKNDKLHLDNIILKNFLDFTQAYNLRFTSTANNFYYIWRGYITRIVINLALANSPKRVIDLGCSSGVIIRSLSEFAPEVECFACDIVEKHRSYWASRTHRINFFTLDIIGGLPFVKESFDTAISLEVLEHLEEPQKLFFEVARILKNEGRFIITTPSTDSISYHILRMMREDIRKRWLKGHEHQHPEFCTLSYINPGVHRVEGFSKDELKNLGKNAGFKLISINSYGMPFPFSPFYDKIPPKLLTWIIEHHSKMFGLQDHIAVFSLQS